MSISRCGRNAEHLAGLVHGQSRKVAQLDELCGGSILMGQLGQGLIEGQELIRRSCSSEVDGVDVEPLAAAAVLFRAFLPRPINEDAAHGLGSGRKEMRAAIPALNLLHIYQAEVSLVD